MDELLPSTILLILIVVLCVKSATARRVVWGLVLAVGLLLAIAVPDHRDDDSVGPWSPRWRR